MNNLYLTRHGRTYINELWKYLSPESRVVLSSKYHRQLNKEALIDLVLDEEKRAEFLRTVGLGSAEDFLVGENLTGNGKNQALSLGKYLSSFGENISSIFVPTTNGQRITRNLRTAEAVQEGFGARKLALYSADSLTDTLGEYIPSDSDKVQRIVSEIAPLDGNVFVLNSGVLEGIVNACDGSLESFDNCGLVVLRKEGQRLVIEQDYLSNDEIKERL